jgi:hypothetical protein
MKVMIAFVSILLSAVVVGASFGAISLKFGAEDRPGFSERTPLS